MLVRQATPSSEASHVTASVAFVTPSYRLDRDRCALLSRSLELFAPSVEHWIVVDRGDLPFFRPLQSNRTTVVAKEEVLPVWVHRLDTLRIGLRSNVWLQARGLPIRGWLLQQFIKLAAAEQLGADILVHADSDVVLLRPFSTSSVVDGSGRVRLYARPGQVDERLPDHVRWHRSAEELLDIESAELPVSDFISSLVPWKRENAVALLEHIQETTGRHWLRALASAWDVSEYTLYGRFAQDVLGSSAGQFVSPSSLCHDYYKHVPLSAPELETLLDRVAPGEIAVSLTSNAGMRPQHYAEVLERRWDALGQEPAEDVDGHPYHGPERTKVLNAVDSRAQGGSGPAGRRLHRPEPRSPSFVPQRRRLMTLARYGFTCAAIVIALAVTMILLQFVVD